MVLVSFIFSATAWAQIQFKGSDKESINLTPMVKVYRDQSKEWRPNTGNIENLFSANKKSDLRISYSTENTWIYFVIKNSSSSAIKRIVYFDSSMVGRVELFLKSGDLWQSNQISGSEFNWADRPLESLSAAFELVIPANGELPVLFKRNSHHQLDTKIIGSDIHSYYTSQKKKLFMVYLYAGAVIALIIYNFFIFIFSRDVAYFYYCLFASGILLIGLNIQGFLDYAFSGLPFVPSQYLMVFSGIGMTLALLFARHFLHIEKYAPKLRYPFYALMAICLGHAILFLTPIRSSIGVALGHGVDLSIGLSLVLMLSTGVYTHFKGNPLSKFYLASWLFIVVSVFFYFASNYGFVEKSQFFYFAINWGNVGEMLTLSLGLAYKISFLDTVQKEAELQSLARERYQRLVRVLVHDVGNPMSVITTYARIMVKANSPDLDVWNKISRASKNITDILNRVRHQHETGFSGDEVILGPVSLRQIFQEATFIFEQMAKNKHVTLKLSNALEEHDVTVLAEKTILLHDIINNILSNAIKFSPKNSEVEIKIDKCDGQVNIETTDHGQGIPDEMLDEFHQHGQIKTIRIGTNGEVGNGFGLALAKNYTELCKGRMEIESSTDTESGNTGTTVRLILNSA